MNLRKSKTESIHSRVTSELSKRIDRVAASKDRSKSNMIEIIIKENIERYEGQNEKID